MRTIAVRFSNAEHRLLQALAGTQGVSVESLVREAIGLSAIGAHAVPSHLHAVSDRDVPNDAPARSSLNAVRTHTNVCSHTAAPAATPPAVPAQGSTRRQQA